MFRDGDKLASYRALAAALALVRADGWRLTIIGDGPERETVENLFSAFGSRVTFLGALPPEQLAEHFASADVLLWPGVGEAFGMSILKHRRKAARFWRRTGPASGTSFAMAAGLSYRMTRRHLPGRSKH